MENIPGVQKVSGNCNYAGSGGEYRKSGVKFYIGKFLNKNFSDSVSKVFSFLKDTALRNCKSNLYSVSLSF